MNKNEKDFNIAFYRFNSAKVDYEEMKSKPQKDWDLDKLAEYSEVMGIYGQEMRRLAVCVGDK